ncbi:asparaginase [Campylobacter troglodytis]|uniref:asparaginase n=1 Tax=Campylobacter troglodytis TaxID=654363 RepID=UPI00115794EE
MIALLATGGTVAGLGDDSGGYKAGILGINELLARLEADLNVSLSEKFTQIHTEQIANIDSCDMSDKIWLKLARRCKKLASKARGIVITHGTDTMEETAFFLSLVLENKLPIILTGAMRPATSIEYEGAKNLYNALLLANSQSIKGVFVTMNGTIFVGKSVQKIHTQNINAFEGFECGYVKDGEVIFRELDENVANKVIVSEAKAKIQAKEDEFTQFQSANFKNLKDANFVDLNKFKHLDSNLFNKKAKFTQSQSTLEKDFEFNPSSSVLLEMLEFKGLTKKAEFNLSRLKKLPRVDILYTYSNDGLAVAAKALFKSGTKGLVIAGSGAGSIHSFQKKTLKALLKKGLKVVVSSRVRAGCVVLSGDDKKLGFISAHHLNPQKARVLLMLTLTKTNDNEATSSFFERLAKI